MTHTNTEQPEPRYADVVHHANVKPSLSYVARKTGLGFQEATQLLELALKRGDLSSGNYTGRRLDLSVEEREQALAQEVVQLRYHVSHLESENVRLIETYAPNPSPTEQYKNVREGVPYNDPDFESLARDLGVWGTSQSAVCAQFWQAAQAQRAPLTDEVAHDVVGNSGVELLSLAEQWADQKIHAYQFLNKAESIVTTAIRRAERAHDITQEQG